MMRRRLIAAIALMSTLAATAVLAAGLDADPHRFVAQVGPATLSVTVDKVVAQVADPIHLVVEVEAPRGAAVDLPRLPQQLGDFDARNTETTRDVPLAENADRRQWALRTTLETIKTGRLEIPALDVHFAADATAPTFKTLRSEPIEIQITSVLEDRADPEMLRDIKDTVDLVVPKASSHRWIVRAAIGVGIVAAAALATLLIARRRGGPTPASWALAQIQQLRQLRPEGAADAASIHNELVDVVREFFELQFNVPSLSRTTRELLNQAASTVGLGEGPSQRLKSLISIADEIKFARHGVTDEQIRQSLVTAKALVLECEEHCKRAQGKAA